MSQNAERPAKSATGPTPAEPEPAPRPEPGAPSALSVYPDPAFVGRLLSGLPPELAASFSERQLFAIQQAFGPWDGQERRKGWHASVRLPWAKYTLSLRWGRP